MTPEQLVEALGRMSPAEQERFVQLLTDQPEVQEVLDDLIEQAQLPVPPTDEELFSDPDVVAYLKARAEEGDCLRAQGATFKPWTSRTPRSRQVNDHLEVKTPGRT